MNLKKMDKVKSEKLEKWNRTEGNNTKEDASGSGYSAKDLKITFSGSEHCGKSNVGCS